MPQSADNAHHYRFLSKWQLQAAPDSVYAALADVANYPVWWSQFRSARQLADGAGELRCRSLLPYELVFTVRREIEDPIELILGATMSGDLNGTSQWTVRRDGDGSIAVFEEDVVVGNATVRRAGPVARPILRFNHDLMMRSGRLGLGRYLARPAAT